MGNRIALLVVLTLCAACGRTVPSPIRATPEPTATHRPTPTPSPTPEPTRLTICLAEEPDSLYVYGTDSPVAHHVWQALYDGPVDSLGYGHQPVILADLPVLEETAIAGMTAAQDGDRVLTAGGSVMTLAPGVTVKDAEGMQTIYGGGTIQMRRMVVTFTLRADIRWADGEPLTAADSVYAFQLAADSDTPTDKHVIERTADYRAVGDYQVIWQGIPGFLDGNYMLNFWHPLPRHAWEDLTAAELLTAERSKRRPMGWGPYVIRTWTAGESITLARNPFYFRASEGLPRLDEVTFRFARDGEALAQHLLSGACDVVTHEASAALDVEALGASAGVRAYTAQDSAWELLAFGISPAADYGRPDFFEDVRVRQAIAQCIDRSSVASDTLTTEPQILHTYLPPDHPVHAREGVTEWAYNPEAGRLLLAEAGWYDEDGDGIREAHGIPSIADGTPFQVTYQTTDSTLRQRSAARVRDYLKACGIEVTVAARPPEVLFAPGPEGALFGRRFDLAQFSWRTTAEPLCDGFLSSQMPGPGNWGRPNVAGFIDDTYDEACLEALGTLPGSIDYVARHSLPQRIFSERVPVLPLFQLQKTMLARDSVVGLSPNSSQRSGLWNIEEIDIDR